MKYSLRLFELIDRFKKNKSVSKNEMWKVQENIKRGFRNILNKSNF